MPAPGKWRVWKANIRKATQQRTAFSFGILFVVILLGLAILFPTPTAFQYTVFRSVLSLAAAGIAAMIPGFITVSISTWLRAGGALAVFAVVYFYNPAALVTSAPSQINDIKGDQNQVINHNTGSITITNEKGATKGKENK
jgi:hypothetical protein